jgi:hypothetical protein
VLGIENERYSDGTKTGMYHELWPLAVQQGLAKILRERLNTTPTHHYLLDRIPNTTLQGLKKTRAINWTNDRQARATLQFFSQLIATPPFEDSASTCISTSKLSSA